MNLTDTFILSVQQQHKDAGLDDHDHYMDMTQKLSTFCHGLESAVAKSHEEKMVLIEQIINYTDNAADCMEGADWKEFVKFEAHMCAGMDILKLLGVKYDPITGKREPLTHQPP